LVEKTTKGLEAEVEQDQSLLKQSLNRLESVMCHQSSTGPEDVDEESALKKHKPNPTPDIPSGIPLAKENTWRFPQKFAWKLSFTFWKTSLPRTFDIGPRDLVQVDGGRWVAVFTTESKTLNTNIKSLFMKEYSISVDDVCKLQPDLPSSTIPKSAVLSAKSGDTDCKMSVIAQDLDRTVYGELNVQNSRSNFENIMKHYKYKTDTPSALQSIYRWSSHRTEKLTAGDSTSKAGKMEVVSIFAANKKNLSLLTLQLVALVITRTVPSS